MATGWAGQPCWSTPQNLRRAAPAVSSATNFRGVSLHRRNAVLQRYLQRTRRIYHSVGKIPTAVKDSGSEGLSTARRIQQYETKEETEDGVVIIKPLQEEWIQQLADLLVENFGKGLGYRGMSAQVFRVQLIFYLKASLRLGSTGVVLIALLQPSLQYSKSQASKAISGRKFQSFKFVPQSIQPIAPASGASTGKKTLIPVGRNSVKKATGLRDFRNDLDAMDNVETPAVNKKESSLFAEEEIFNPGNGSSTVGVDLERPNTKSNTSRGDSRSDEEQNMSRVNQDSSTSLQDSGQTRGELLLGTTELSLDSSTRSSFFGLINPIKSGAYLCNMAVAPRHQRRGHATRLIKACEDITWLAGHKDIFLQARIDEEGPQALYRGYGFVDEKEDSLVMTLMNYQEKKVLLRKCLNQ